MSNFMGPMAPPQAAPSQPPQLDIRTNPNQRERFRDFMRQNTRPSMGMALPMVQPMMQPMAPTTMPMAPMPPAPNPPIPMAIRPTPPMMPQPMAAIDVFSPQYMNQPRPMRLEEGGDVPMPSVMPNSKQKDVMLRIAYDEALRKGAVENALRQLETDRLIERSKEMELERIRDIERQDRLDDVKRMRLEAELADRNYRLKGLLTPPDQGLEDDPLFALPIKREDGGSVPPRRTEIRGQDHMLSYITPDEADILKALGGSGEAGPMGIPSFYDEGEPDSIGGDQAASATGEQGDPSDAGFDSFGGDDAGDKAEDAKAASIAAAQEALAASQAAQEAREARDLVARTFATSNKGKSLVGAPNSEFGYVTTGKPSDSQVADALAAAKSLGMDISNVDSDLASELGLDDTPTTAVEAISSPTAQGKKSEVDLLLDIFSMPTTPQTKTATQQQQALPDELAFTQGMSSVAPTQTVDDPMAVARAMDQISPKGLLDAGLLNAAANFASDLLGLTPDPEAVRSDYENRSYSSLGMSPGLASAVLGTQTATGPVTGAIGGPRGFLGSLAFGPYSPGAAGMTGMTPDGKSTGAITGDQLADLATRNRSGILGGISGFFNDMTLSAASKSNVAVVNPATGQIVGAIDGKGRYTGDSRFNPNPKDNFKDRGGNEPYIPPYIPPVVDPVVDDGTPNILGGMGDTPYQPLVQNFTGDGRERFAGTLRMPVGYGDPRTGFIAPQAFSTAGFMPPAGPIPIGFFEDGGEVLNQAADNFLEALTAA